MVRRCCADLLWQLKIHLTDYSTLKLPNKSVSAVEVSARAYIELSIEAGNQEVSDRLAVRDLELSSELRSYFNVDRPAYAETR